MTRREHFVRFMSPGTMFDEETVRPIATFGDTKEAMNLATEIVERHGAVPYGFQFTTCITADPIPDGEGGTLRVEPKTAKTSGTYYIKGTVLTFDVAKTSGARILLSNMEYNGWWIMCETKNKYSHTGIFGPDDFIVNSDGLIVDRGDSKEHVAYRAVKDAEKAAKK